MFLAAISIAIVALIYAPLLMARTNGQTLGRMAVGIRVVRNHGGPMTFGFAMLREVVVKALLFGIVELVHVRAGEPGRRALAAVRRREPRAARLHRGHARRARLAAYAATARWKAADSRPSSVQMICSRPGPTLISAIGTPTNSEM